MVNEGRIASFDGAVLSLNPQLRVAGFMSIPPPGSAYDWSTTISASADDADEDYGTPGVTRLALNQLNIGQWAAPARYMAGLRYLIDIPESHVISPNFKIESATFRFYVATVNLAPLVGIYIEETENSSVFVAAIGNISGRTRSTGYVEYDPPTPPWSGWDSVDITALIENWFAKYTYTSGNYLGLIMRELTGGVLARIQVDTQDFGPMNFPSQISISYTI